jgi:hypothetical protein
MNYQHDLFPVNVSVLCAQRKSIYSQLSGLHENGQLIEVDIFDQKRNAFTFSGCGPVVAHPPCRLWGRLKGFPNLTHSQKTKERDLGRFCAERVIQNGGVLEHPFDSGLFADMGLPSGGFKNDLGFTLEVPQRMFGHSMIKMTWLFFSKIPYSEIEPVKPALHGSPLKKIHHLSAKQREATPYSLACYLVRHAARAKQPVDLENSESENSQLSQVKKNSQFAGTLFSTGGES